MNLIKSTDPATPHLYYSVGSRETEADFEVALAGTVPIRFTVTRHFIDRGAGCTEYRPATWLDHYLMHQEVSKAKGKEIRSLRFCTYERTRDDKLVEI